MAMPNTNLGWKKSSFSSTNTNCIEIAHDQGESYVRDTKNRDGGVLTFQRASWTALIVAARNGQ